MKKLNKLVAILVALAMMAMVSVISAFATTAPAAATDEEQDAAAIVGKYLQVAEGVTVPNVNYTYTFTHQPSRTETAGPDKTVSFNARTDMQDVNASTSNDKAWKTTVAAVFTENDELVFTAPGEYIYRVTESADKSTATTNGVTETYTNDVNGAHYFTVRIYVNYDEHGDLQISSVTIADENGKKLDPTEDPTIDTGDDKFDPAHPEGGNFVNRYQKSKTVEEDPEDLTPDEALLKVQKTVVDTQNYIDDDQAFPFTITVNKPANDTVSGDSVLAYYYDATNGVDTEHPVTITYDTASDFALKNGQYLLFNTLPYGATYTVTETLGDSDIVNKANIQAEATWTDGAVTAVDKGDNLTVGTGTVADTDTTLDAAAYTNTFDTSDVTPTGILLNNLPYIVLALVAIGGLCAYVIVRRKNADEA